VNAPYAARARARRGDRARILLAIVLIVFTALVGMLGWAPPARGQEVSAAELPVTRIDLSVGRSYPVSMPVPITRVSIADTAVADVIVVSERELVITGRRSGEADAIVWLANGTRRHYRILVRQPADRMQIVLYVKFAEVRRNLLEQLGTSIFYNGPNVAIGTGVAADHNNVRRDPTTGNPTGMTFPLDGDFISVLTDFGTDRLLALILAEQTSGRARILAEPNLMAGNRDTARFLAGGELPIPIVQGGAGVGAFQSVTVVFREFGVRLRFIAEILNEELVRLNVEPEVSTLDFSNAVTLSGFRIPALRTRRMESTLDVRRNQSLVISGMFNNEQERVRTGVPLLKDLPIIGLLFSSTSFQRNETELLVVVRPVVIDPMRPRPQDVVPTAPDTALPARDGLRRQPPIKPTDIPPVMKP
jgi:pilus assembly protein CpaC